MQRWIVAIATGVLAIASMRVHARCIDADVTIDAGHSRIDVQMQLPPDVARIELASLGPFHRRDLWRSPDDSAAIEDDAIAPRVASHRQLRVSIDVTRNLAQADRAYTPFLRFHDGTVAVYSAMLAAADTSPVKLCPRFVPAKGEQVIGYGRVLSQALHPDAAAGPGYVAFGTPQVTQSGSLLMVTDRGVPAALHARVADVIPGIVDFYAKYLGAHALPVVYLYMAPEVGAGRSYKGDHLDASITLGLLGQGWDTPDDPQVLLMIGFVAHELFHSWNSGGALGSPEGEALLAKEGGAEFAKVLATAHVLHRNESEWLKDVAAAFNACRYAQREGISVRAALQNRSPGGLPYDCGMPMMLALAAAANPRDPASGYFDLWKRLAARRGQDAAGTYRWQDLLADPASPSSVTLEHAVGEPGAYVSSLTQVLEAPGFKVSPAAVLTADDRARIAGLLLAHVMQQDCGNYSFWTQPDGFPLDDPLPGCKTLRPGAKVTALLGQALHDADLQAMALQIAQRCAAGLTVEVGYSDAQKPSQVHCTQALDVPPRPVDIVRSAATPEMR